MSESLLVLDIPEKIISILSKHGYSTIESVIDAGYKELLQIDGIGQQSILAIYDAIASDRYYSTESDKAQKLHWLHIKDRWQLRIALNLLNKEQRLEVVKSKPPEGWNGTDDWK